MPMTQKRDEKNRNFLERERDVEQLAELVERYLEQHPEVSKVALAERANISRTHLYALLGRENSPSVEIAKRLAEAIGWDIKLAKKPTNGR